jgi:predicted phage-related endonuclease
MAHLSFRYPNAAVRAVPIHEKSSVAWLTERGNTIGASEIGMAIGVSKYGGLLDLISNKRAQRGGAATHSDSPAMADGRDAESAILAMAFRRLAFLELEMHAGEAVRDAVISATPDAVLVDRSGLVVATVEAKLDRSRTDWSAVEDGNFSGLEPRDLRLAYWWQVQHQLKVTGCAFGYLAVWSVYDLTVIRIEADAEASAIIDQAAYSADAWISHPDGALPEPTIADTLSAVACSIRPATDEALTVDGAVATALEEYAAAAAAIKALEEQQDAAKRIVLAAHASSAKLQTASGFKSSFVAPSVRTGLDSKRLTEELPDIAAKYSKTTEVSGSCRITAPRAKK